MRKLVELNADPNISWIKEIQNTFEPLLNLLALDNELFILKQNEFSNILKSEKPFLTHPFHLWFRNLLKEGIILDSVATNDTVRNLFLNRIALQAPDCLQCSDEHGCCHGTYSIEPIDYDRIIANRLIDSTIISRFLRKYKVKLIKDQNRQIHCGAFDISSKKCLIHQYKPPTCCKYPLISDVHKWSSELMAWTGNCAHRTEPWVTRVHPAIMNVLREIWVSAQFLYETEQNVFYRLKTQQKSEIKVIISRILALTQCSKLFKPIMIKKILSEDYSEGSIQEALQMMKKF